MAFALFGGVVEPGVLGRDAAFGLVGVVRGAADVADGSVGALVASRAASGAAFWGSGLLIEGLLGFEQRIDLAGELPKRLCYLGRVVLGM